MGHVYADITLLNSLDDVLVQRGDLPKENVRKVEVKAVVDCNVMPLFIDDEIAHQLDLSVQDQVDVVFANGSTCKCNRVGPVDILFQNRRTACLAVVLPETTMVRLGVIPLSGMDVLIDPCKHQLVVHPARPHCARMRV